jgi:cullin-associated NEDD8-dissociated protein 1
VQDLKESLSSKFGELEASFTYLTDELIGQGLWNNVTVVIASDFGRTLTVNSREGSDHGWGGNYFMMGGSVKGGKIYGQFPQDITETSPVNYGRGRIAPTTSWDSIMNSVADWMGIEDDAGLDYCLPNRRRTGTKLFKKEEVFVV